MRLLTTIVLLFLIVSCNRTKTTTPPSQVDSSIVDTIPTDTIRDMSSVSMQRLARAAQREVGGQFIAVNAKVLSQLIKKQDSIVLVVAGIQQKLEGETSSNIQARTTLTTLQSQVDGIIATNTKQDTRITAATTANTAQDTKIQTITTANTSNTNAINSINTTNASQETRLVAAINKNVLLDTSVVRIQRDLSSFKLVTFNPKYFSATETATTVQMSFSSLILSALKLQGVQ